MIIGKNIGNKRQKSYISPENSILNLNCSLHFLKSGGESSPVEEKNRGPVGYTIHHHLPVVKEVVSNPSFFINQPMVKGCRGTSSGLNLSEKYESQLG